MLDHRNTTSHNYLADEPVAENYDDIAALTPKIRSTIEFLKARSAGVQ